MKKTRITGGDRLLFALLFFAVFLSVLKFTAEAGSANLAVTQTFTVYNAGSTDPSDVFSYALTAVGSAPKENECTFSLKGNQAKNITFSFPDRGEYSYTLRQTTQKKSWYIYDEEVFTVKAYVTDKIYLVVYNTAGKKVSEIRFANAYYYPSPVPTSTPAPYPRTGDSFSPARYAKILLLSFAAAACLTAILVYPHKKRNKKIN